jgi:predicted O-methyltransferase YrrM
MRQHRPVLVKLLRDAFKGLATIRGAEVGVSWGNTSEVLLRELPGLQLTMIDPWTPWKLGPGWVRGAERLAAERETARTRTVFAEDRREIWEITSDVAAGRIPDGSLDFAFVDGDHRYETVRKDIRTWVEKVRPGGLLVGHDYVDPLPTKYAASRYPQGVKRAVNEWVIERDLVLYRHAGSWLWWVQV